MSSRLLVTGPTGVAGSACVGHALKDPGVERVTVLARRRLEVEHPKLEVILHSDFQDYSSVRPVFRETDAVLWCLGISQNLVPKDEYERITYDFVVAAAKALAAVNPDAKFCHLSGGGADSKEKSRILFARVKGRAENALNRSGLTDVYHFRPAYIHPPRPREKNQWTERLAYTLAPLMIRVAPSTIIRSDDLARAMIHVAQHGADKRILENRDIQRIAKDATA